MFSAKKIFSLTGALLLLSFILPASDENLESTDASWLSDTESVTQVHSGILSMGIQSASASGTRDSVGVDMHRTSGNNNISERRVILVLI